MVFACVCVLYCVCGVCVFFRSESDGRSTARSRRHHGQGICGKENNVQASSLIPHFDPRCVAALGLCAFCPLGLAPRRAGGRRRRCGPLAAGSAAATRKWVEAPPRDNAGPRCMSGVVSRGRLPPLPVQRTDGRARPAAVLSAAAVLSLSGSKAVSPLLSCPTCSPNSPGVPHSACVLPSARSLAESSGA